MIVLHTRAPEEQLKESQKRVQEKEQSRDREKSREKKLLPKGVQNHHSQLSSHSPIGLQCVQREAMSK